jgi:hypothetical protein
MATAGHPSAPWGVRTVATLLGLGMLGALTVLVPSHPAGATRAPGPLAPAQGVLFGAHPRSPNSSDEAERASLLDLESILGRRLAIDHYFRPWKTGEVPIRREQFPTFREQWDFDNGRIPMISWGKTYSSDIVAGVHDAYIRTQGAAIAALGQPLFLRWFWEMDGNRNQEFAQSPDLYKAAWQRIRTLFWEQGATNAVFVWCPNASAFDTGKAELYYPGDDYVDWVCADGYNWYTRPGQNNASFRSIYQGFVDWATARTRPKPIMVGEYGVLEATSDPNHKPDWVNATRETLKTDLPAVAAVVYFNSEGNDSDGIYRDWRVDTSAASLQAFQLMGADPYFDGAPAAPNPDTGIVSGPAGTVRSTSATFTFSSDQAGAGFQCRLDGAGFSACTSPVTYTGLGQGSHSFEVRARTAAGGTDPTPARRTWVVDTWGPWVTTMAPGDGAGGVAVASGVRAVFSEALDPATMTASNFTLSGGAGTVAASVTYDAATRSAFLSPSGPLQPGTAYTVTVKGGPSGVADPLGNPMFVDRVWRFTTAAAPETTITSGPPNPAGPAAAFAFSSSQPGASFQCRLDAAPFADCTSPTSYSGLADGGHAFEVRAWTLAAGADPSAARWTWSVDTTAPTVTGIAPADGAAGVAVEVVLRATFSEAVDAGSVSPSSFVLTGGPAAGPVEATVSYDPASRTASLTPGAPLAPGNSYTATVKGGAGGVADPAGNPLAADRIWGFTTFAPPPETAIDSGPTGTVASANATFTFSSDPGSAGFQCRLDGAAFADCTSPATFSGLADGAHTFEVRGWTVVGGTDPTPAARTWSVNTAPPSFAPVADARVEKARPATNYGRSSTLKVANGVETYLRFDVGGLTGPVQKAVLRLFVANGTNDGPAVYGTGNSWTESGPGSITWKNRPAPTGSAVDDKGRLAQGRWVEYDVTSLVSGNGTFSFVLATKSQDGLSAYSREKSTKRPELVVTTG